MIEPRRYVSRGGDKLNAALEAFQLDPAGWTCADLGSHVGGFVDCLLRRGAARAYSVDTSYGTLAWTLRRDPRVVVLERTNAMHIRLPEPADLVTIDVGWTRQEAILPNTMALLKPGGFVVTLIKPHYEAAASELEQGVVVPDKFEGVVERVLHQIRSGGWRVVRTVDSPIPGHGGNVELFACLQRRETQP